MSSSQRNIITGHNMELHENIQRIKQMMGVIKESTHQIFTPDYYLDDFYNMDGMDFYTEEQALDKIQKVIDYVLNIEYPIKVYRGINTVNPDENYIGASWTTDIRVAEGFGDKIYVGLILSQDVIDVEQTMRTRVMNPYEYEIYVPNFEDIKLIDEYSII
jgi:hypothetical protein